MIDLTTLKKLVTTNQEKSVVIIPETKEQLIGIIEALGKLNFKTASGRNYSVAFSWCHNSDELPGLNITEGFNSEPDFYTSRPENYHIVYVKQLTKKRIRRKA